MNRDKLEWPRRRRGLQRRDALGILFGLALLALLLLVALAIR
jgi:hypothetical protein